MPDGLIVKTHGFDELFEFLKPTKQRQVWKNVINKVAVDVKAESVDNIGNNYNLSKRYIRPKIQVRRATIYKLTAYLFAHHRAISFMSFKGTKQNKSGVSVEIRRGRRRVIKSGFISKPSGKDYSSRGQKQSVSNSSDKKVAFKRAGGTRPGIRKPAVIAAYPIIAMKAMTLCQMVGGDWNRKIINRSLSIMMKKYFDIELIKGIRKSI